MKLSNHAACAAELVKVMVRHYPSPEDKTKLAPDKAIFCFMLAMGGILMGCEDEEERARIIAEFAIGVARIANTDMSDLLQ